MHVLNKRSPDFILICDTRLSSEVENTVREEWNGRCMFSSFSSQARGVAIFVKQNNPATIIDEYKDSEGNILCVLMNYEEKRILLEIVYGPNLDSPNFFRNQVFSKIDEWMPDFSIISKLLTWLWIKLRIP